MHTLKCTCKSETSVHGIELVSTGDDCSVQHDLGSGSHFQSRYKVQQRWGGVCYFRDKGGSEDSTLYHSSHMFILNVSNCRGKCCTAPLQTNSFCHSACEGHLLPRTDSTLSTGGQCHHSICIQIPTLIQ